MCVQCHNDVCSPECLCSCGGFHCARSLHIWSVCIVGAMTLLMHATVFCQADVFELSVLTYGDGIYEIV